MIYLISGPLFIVPLICIPIILLSILAIQPIVARNSAAVSTSAQSRQGLLVEILGGLDALRASGAFALMKRKFLAQSNHYTQATHQAKTYSQLNGNTITIVQQVAQVAIIVYGFHLFVEQVITMGAIIATVILSGKDIGPLAKIGQTLGRANAAYVARNNLRRFLSAQRMRHDDKTFAIRQTENIAVEINNATLKLSELGRPLFNGLNLSVKQGEKVAIVGRTGSGKTSLMKLVVGLLAPETGTVMLNGADVRQYSRADLFRTVGTVFQDPWLFSGTLRDNVALGQDDCDDEQVLNCLKGAGANFVNDGTGGELDFFAPDSTKVSDVRKYLREFLMDKRVVDIPYVLRWILVNLIIAIFRAPKSAAEYRKLFTGRGSPLKFYTEDLTAMVQKKLAKDYAVEFGMRA